MTFSRALHKKESHDTNLRNFIFGVEDSLVSTVGLLAGVAVASVSRSAIITTGLVLIVVEGLSMGIGSFLTEETTDEMAGNKPQILKDIIGAIIMFISYCLAGLIPLAPYALMPVAAAVTISVALSLLGLLILGLGTSLYFHKPHPWARGFKMFLLGGSAVAVGMLVGKILSLRVQ